MAPTSRGARGRAPPSGAAAATTITPEDLIASTLESLEGLGLQQLESVEVCNSIISGDFQDYGDTTDLPKSQDWEGFVSCLDQWRNGEDGGGLWTVLGGRSKQQQQAGGSNEEEEEEQGQGHHHGHKALLAMVHLAMNCKEKAEEAWPASCAYLLLMDLPGSSAFGVFNASMFRTLLALFKHWLEASSGAGGGNPQGGGGEKKGQRSSKRGAKSQKDKDAMDEDEESEEDEDDDDDDEDGGGRRRKAKSRRGGRRAATSSASSTASPVPMLDALRSCLSRGNLSSSLDGHEDLLTEMVDLVVGTLASSATGTLAAEAARAILTGMLVASGARRTVALRALMPLLIMRPLSKPGMPHDARGRTEAHQKALQLLLHLAKEPLPEEGEEDTEPGKEEEGEEANASGGEGGAAPMDVDTNEGSKGEKEAEEGEEGEEEEQEGGEDEEAEGDEDDEEEGKKKGGKKKKQQRGKAKRAGEKPSNLHMTVLAVIQHMCSEAPDRADVRGRLAESVLTLVKGLFTTNATVAPRFVLFLAKLIRSAKVSHRSFGVEVASSFVLASWAWEIGDQASSLVALVESFTSRILDKAPSVRVRAMVCLSEMLNCLKDPSTPQALREVLISLAFPSGTSEEDGMEESESASVNKGLLCMVRSRSTDDKAVVRKAAIQALEILLVTKAAEGGSASVLQEEDIKLFAERCNDVSVLTRKQAMSSLSALLLAYPQNAKLQETWVQAILPLVSDPEQSLLNRLVELVDQVILDRVLEWMNCHKHPGGRQGAGRSGRKTRNAAEESEAGTDAEEVEGHGEIDTSVWSLLSIVASRDLHRCLQSAVNLLLASSSATARRLKDLMEALQTAALLSIEGEGSVSNRRALRRGTWALLEAFLATSSTSGSGGLCAVPSDPGFVITCWRKVYEICGSQSQEDEEDDGLDDDAHKILRVLSRIASEVPADAGMELAEELLSVLVELDGRLSPGNCGAALETVAALCLAKAPSEAEGAKICTQAAQQILLMCEKALRHFVVNRHTDEATMASLERATFLTGAVAILGFSANEEEAKKETAAPKKSSRKTRGSKAHADDSSSASSSGPLIRIPIPPATISLVRVLLAPELLPLPETDGTKEGEDVPQTRVAVPIPEQVRAHAFLALGKICLRDKTLGKENVNLFVRELSVGSSPAIKSNALLILGDLCVRYTSLVERHVPAMARCLQDQSGLIRRHALSLISQLLLQDYLKWRGLLLHRYLAILVDKDRRVSETAEFLIFQPLLRKYPSLFVNHFVEALVVFNGCTDHDSYKAAVAQGAESGTAVTMEGINLEGQGVNAKKRLHVYTSMLQHMSDEQRIQVAAKLTQDILAAATEEDGEGGGIKIQSYHRAKLQRLQQHRREALMEKLQRDENLIRDALAVLRCQDIKVATQSSSRGGGDAAAGDEDTEGVGMEESQGGAATSQADAAAAAKGRLLSKVSRKHLMEHIVPTLVSLKCCLERAHSPLLREVMDYFSELMKANKDEVKDAMGSDPTLFHEIEYDLQQYEKEFAARQQAQDVKPIPDHATSRTPGSVSAGRVSEDGAPRRVSMGPPSGGAALARRRSSLGARTPLAPTTTTSGSLTGCSAPKLRRSSIGAPSTRTPSEAIKAAMQGDLEGSPLPLKMAVMASGGTKGDKATSSAVKREPLVVKQPTPISGEKGWNVSVHEEGEGAGAPEPMPVQGRTTRGGGAQKENTRRTRRK